jgi:hypothetical protein
MPGSYRVVEYFKQKSNLEDGPRYKVQLREWVPNWLAGKARPCIKILMLGRVILQVG